MGFRVLYDGTATPDRARMTGHRLAPVQELPASAGKAQPGEDAGVLFVGADPADMHLTRDLVGEPGSRDFQPVQTARQAADFLHRRPPFPQAARPAIILVDLDLAEGARETVQVVKEDPRLSAIPVIVLTRAPEDAAEAYALGANCVVPRPPAMDDYFAVVRALQRFWLGTALLG